MNQDLMVFFLQIICLKNKGWAYVINFDEYPDVGTYWIALFCEKTEIVCFDSFGADHINKEFVKNITVNIFRKQSNNSIMCG